MVATNPNGSTTSEAATLTVIAETRALSISHNNGRITITWQGSGTLESTTALNGAATVWTIEATTGKTYTTSATEPMKFYRLQQ